MLSVDNAKLAVMTIVATIEETEPMPAPQTHMWLALQQAGTLGPEIDDWYALLALGKKIGVWTHTSETVSLTDMGRKYGAELNASV